MLLKKLWCAFIVYLAYYQMGYYSLFGMRKAIIAYFNECRTLKADVLTVERNGMPVGTLLCARDHGWLPTDLAFPEAMVGIRDQYRGRLAYFGKFAVLPTMRGRLHGKQLHMKAVSEWSLANDVEAVVMIVNPRHARYYHGVGATEVARTEGTVGLEKAPAVLMILNYQKSKVVREFRRRYLFSLCEEHECAVPSTFTA